MFIPSGEIKATRYEEAYQRALVWYKKYPKLYELDQKIADILLSLNNPANYEKTNNMLKEMQKEHNQYLKINGIPANYKAPRFECNKCQDSGWIEVPNYEASEKYGYEVSRAVKCSCLINAEKQLMVNNYFKASCLTPIMLKQTFNKFRLDVYSDIEFFHGYSHREIMKANKEIAQEFVTKMDQVNKGVLGYDVKGLYFAGNPGVGKTFLCSAIANSLLKRKVPVLYLPFVDFMHQLRGTISDNKGNIDQYIEAAKEVDVLILDDLGSESITDFSQEVLFTIINYRTGCLNKPIIISSNYSIDELKRMYHGRIASRIRRHADILHCVGDDLREIIK